MQKIYHKITRTATNGQFLPDAFFGDFRSGKKARVIHGAYDTHTQHKTDWPFHLFSPIVDREGKEEVHEKIRDLTAW